MAAKSDWCSAWFRPIAFLVFSLLVSQARGQCVDGTYNHDGKDCCQCGVGLKVLEHCSANLQSGKCDACEPGSYSSHPNDKTFCDRCTSCSHPSENLEVDEPCTRAKDAKCRCQKDHYCVSGTETCKLCHPCKKCGDEGIKIACAGRNDTVCNDISKGLQESEIAVIVIAVITMVILIAMAALIWRRRQSRLRKPTTVSETNGRETDVEMQQLNVPDVDLQPLLHDIAGVLAWKDMEEIATRSNIPEPKIESFKLNHPGDAEEQTVQLLKCWAESQGSEAPTKLIQILNKMNGRKGKAQKILDILSRGSSLPA